MANLNRAAAKWRLFEFDERHDALTEMDCSDRGNIATRLVHATNETATLERFEESIARVQTILPNCELAVLSPAEVTFRSKQEIVFGVGPEERVLEDHNWALFVQLLEALREARHPYGSRQHRLFRMRPERWLESLVRADVSVIDERLQTESVYSQVPAFSAADRAMIDVLTLTHEGRLAVLELKADEDIHLPLQGLDYWARVEWQPRRILEVRLFWRTGARRRSAATLPGCSRVACASGNRHNSALCLAEIEWAFVGIDERWRAGVRVVFR